MGTDTTPDTKQKPWCVFFDAPASSGWIAHCPERQLPGESPLPFYDIRRFASRSEAEAFLAKIERTAD